MRCRSTNDRRQIDKASFPFSSVSCFLVYQNYMFVLPALAQWHVPESMQSIDLILAVVEESCSNKIQFWYHHEGRNGWVPRRPLQSRSRSDSTPSETHDNLTTTPGERKFKFDEDPMIFCLTYSTVQSLNRGIAIACGNVSQLEHIVKQRNEPDNFSLSPSTGKPVRK